MKTGKLLIAFLLLMTITTNIAIAQENTTKQEKVITLDTNGQTGHLKYIEEYYIVNSTGKLVLDKRKLFFNGNINKSKISFKIRRPLTSDGKPYPENWIKANATVDNKTIINSWYKAAENENEKPGNSNKTPGFELSLATLVIIIMFIYKKR